MIVSYPLTIRRDTLETKTYEEGTLEAVLSEFQIFFETEEGDVEHLPDYGVKKRDLLFNADLDDVVFGVLLLRIQEKVNVWFNGVTVLDIYQDDEAEDLPPKTLRLVIKLDYNGQEGSVEVDLSER